MNKPCVGVYLQSGSYIGFSIAQDKVSEWRVILSQALHGEHPVQQLGFDFEKHRFPPFVIAAGDLLEFKGNEIVAWRIFEESESETTKLQRETLAVMKQAVADGDEWKGGGA